jgi:hypothetical protein
MTVRVCGVSGQVAPVIVVLRGVWCPGRAVGWLSWWCLIAPSTPPTPPPVLIPTHCHPPPFFASISYVASLHPTHSNTHGHGLLASTPLPCAATRVSINSSCLAPLHHCCRPLLCEGVWRVSQHSIGAQEVREPLMRQEHMVSERGRARQSVQQARTHRGLAASRTRVSPPLLRGRT